MSRGGAATGTRLVVGRAFVVVGAIEDSVLIQGRIDASAKVRDFVNGLELDVRTLYLRDLTFFGCTFQEDVVFDNIVRYIEQGRIRPFVAREYPLADIVQAQEDFIAKKYAGKLVLVPPQDD